jgi:Zn-finger nucleic acid-binding protein
MARICPDCETNMVEETVDGVTVNACPKCAGVWVHPEAITEILEKDPIGLLELEDKNVSQMEQRVIGHSVRNCPDDSMTLQEYHYCYDSPIIIQVCTECGGFWIEDGQLKKMQAWVDEANRPISKQEQDQLDVAKFTLDHENFMIRQENIRNIFTRMNRFRPGWFI